MMVLTNSVSTPKSTSTLISNHKMNSSTTPSTSPAPSSRSATLTPLENSVENLKNSTKPKRKYSKNGCRECKRRKMKCDETKPHCWQCSRLEKPCVYDMVKEPKVTKKRKKSNHEDKFDDNNNNSGYNSSIDPIMGDTTKRLSPLSHSSSSSSTTSLLQTQPIGIVNNYKSSLSNILNTTLPFNNSIQKSTGTSPQNGLLMRTNSISSMIRPPPFSYNQMPISQTRLPPTSSSPSSGEESLRLNSISSLISPSYNHKLSNPYSIPAPPTSSSSSSSTTILPPLNNSFQNKNLFNNYSIIDANNNFSNDKISKDPLRPRTASIDSKSTISQNTNVSLATTPTPNLNKSLENDFNVSLLADDINKLVSNSLYDSTIMIMTQNQSFNFEPAVYNNNNMNVDNTTTSDESVFDISSFNYSINHPPFDEDLRISQNSTPVPPNLLSHVSLESIEISPSHKKYLELFYTDFAKIILPLEPFENNNPIRDILLTQASNKDYLLCAILACGAGIKYTKDNNLKDKKQCNKYLSSCYEFCLKSLEDEKILIDEIEPILLTIMLLTSFNATSRKQEWRTHLRGAKDLLSKYLTTQKNLQISLVLALCIHWFIGFEVLVGLNNNPNGGTVKNENELDYLVTSTTGQTENLKTIGVITQNGFNLLHGYHQTMLIKVKDLIKLVNRYKNGCSISIFDTLNLLSQFENERYYKIISTDGKIPTDHPLYYKNCNDYNEEISQKSFASKIHKGIIMLYDDNEEISMYFMHDICHQSYVHTCLLIITVTFLGLDKFNSKVIELVNKINSLSYFLPFIDPTNTIKGKINKDSIKNSSLKYYLMITQWPLLTAGMYLTSRTDQMLIENYFKLLEQLNVGSASYSLRRLYKAWNNNSDLTATNSPTNLSKLLKGSDNNKRNSLSSTSSAHSPILLRSLNDNTNNIIISDQKDDENLSNHSMSQKSLSNNNNTKNDDVDMVPY